MLKYTEIKLPDFLLVALAWIIIPWSGCDTRPPLTDEEKAYVQEINDWHQKRITSLTRETGWLSLAGLLWLEEGANTFGGGSDQMVRFPADKAAPKMGVIFLEGDRIRTEIEPGVDVLNGSEKVLQMEMRADISGNPTILSHGSLSWLIIKRGDRYAVRLRDTENPARINFAGIERFDVRPEWRIKAKLEPYDPPRMIEIPSVLGTVTNEACPGALVFTVDGESYRLEPLGEAGAKSLFLIFADLTNGEETYGAGRFLSVDAPGPDGYTYIDFNKSYNPPCAFTRYATCPLPPPQNVLPLEITAGEKYHGDH